MDTPPSIPPGAASVAMPVANALDEKLLKRARHAGRNLSVLAMLAAFVAIALIAAALFAKETRGGMTVFAATIALIAAGYWVLAVAARRGNPHAVGVVIVAMVLQICLSLIFSGIAAARTGSPFQAPVGGLIIPILVLLALASSRKVLLELRERDLWDRVFGSAKPSASLCLIGGALLVSGFISMNASSYYVGWKVGHQQRAEIQHAKAFIELIQQDENEFLKAMQEVSGSWRQGEIEIVLARFETLEQHFEVLKTEAAGADRLLQILTTYGNALRQWKNGLTLLQESEPDTDRARQMFQLGDRLRTDACQEFDRRYASKKP